MPVNGREKQRRSTCGVSKVPKKHRKLFLDRVEYGNEAAGKAYKG